jgi:hypothetical protein
MKDNANRIADPCWLFLAALLLLAPSIFANDLSVDHRTLQLDESVTIVVSLEGSFAEVDNVNVPVQNLVITGRPLVSSQFSWINGTMTRRKIFRFSAKPKGPGAALVGPLVVQGSDGQTETLAPVSLQVMPDLTAGSNDPQAVLRELLATRRDPIFVVAEADRNEAFAGGEIVVTWTIYNATHVEQWQIVDLPKLEDFWTEELDVRNEPQQEVILGDNIVQRVRIRRVALFPLRSGTLTVGSLGIEAVILRRMDTGFGLFEGSNFELTRRSAPLTFEVHPLPPGPPVDAVGDVTLTCGKPQQRGGGPVTMVVTMRGRANLRAARPPRWESVVDGSVQIGDRPMTVERTHEAASMTRTWSYSIFPARAGRLTVPPLIANILTSAGARQQLRCEGSVLDVSAVLPPTEPPPATEAARTVRTLRPYLPWLLGSVLLLLLVGLSIPRLQRFGRMRREVRALTHDRTPVEVLEAVHALLASRHLVPLALMNESSERGDAYRALRSLVDAADRRVEIAPSEIADRVRELVRVM